MHPARLSMIKWLPLIQDCNFGVSFYFPDDRLPVSNCGSLLPYFTSRLFVTLSSHDLILFQFLVELKILWLKLLVKRSLGLHPKCKFMMVPLSQGHFLCYPVAAPMQVLICRMNAFCDYSDCHDWDVRLSQWEFVILCGILDASLQGPSLSVHINPISWGQTLNERPQYLRCSREYDCPPTAAGL